MLSLCQFGCIIGFLSWVSRAWARPESDLQSTAWPDYIMIISRAWLDLDLRLAYTLDELPVNLSQCSLSLSLDLCWLAACISQTWARPLPDPNQEQNQPGWSLTELCMTSSWHQLDLQLVVSIAWNYPSQLNWPTGLACTQVGALSIHSSSLQPKSGTEIGKLAWAIG